MSVFKRLGADDFLGVQDVLSRKSLCFTILTVLALPEAGWGPPPAK
jgi:hypothetical protein